MSDLEQTGHPRSAGESYTGSGRRSHSILIVLFLIYMSDYADRYVISSMIHYIQEDWKITDAQAGWLMGIVLLFITVFSAPASILIDRWSRRKMVAIMTFFWSLATLACAFTSSYFQLLVARAFIGIGESGYAPGGTAMLAAAYPEEKRARVMGIWNASIPLGIGLGLAAGGLIARRWGWHHAFGLVALPGMGLALAAWFLPDYRSVKVQDTGTGIGRGFLRDLTVVFRIPSLVLTYLGFAMNVSITTALMTWLPSYFERTGIAEPGRGGALATPIFALVMVGAPLGGFLADSWAKRQRNARLLLPVLSSVLAAITLWAAFSCAGQKFLQIGILCAYGIFITSFIAPAAAVTQDVVHPGLRAFSYAMCVIVQHLAGDIWSAPLLGWLSDRIGLEQAVFFIPAYGVIAAIFFFFGSRFYVRDLDRVEKVRLEPEPAA